MKIDWWWGFPLKKLSLLLLLLSFEHLSTRRSGIVFLAHCGMKRVWLVASLANSCDESMKMCWGTNQHLFYCPKGIFFSRCSSKIPLRNSSTQAATSLQTLKIIFANRPVSISQRDLSICQPILWRTFTTPISRFMRIMRSAKASHKSNSHKSNILLCSNVCESKKH